MINRILVPIAFSRYSQTILNYAAELAEPIGAELFIVNVINERDLQAVNKIASFGYKVDSKNYVDIIEKERKDEIKRLTGQLTLADDKVSFSLLVGDPTSELLRYIVENRIDLVVMGLRANDIKHVFAGSVAERMFRRCPVPIVSIRGDDVAERLRKRVYKHIIDS